MSRAILGFASTQELATHLGRSPFAIARRLKSLRRAGVEPTLEALRTSKIGRPTKTPLLDVPWDEDPIALDLIDANGASIDAIAKAYGASGNYIWMLEQSAIAKLKAAIPRHRLPHLHERIANSACAVSHPCEGCQMESAINRMIVALDKHDGDVEKTRSWAEIFDRSILDVLEAYELGEISEIGDDA